MSPGEIRLPTVVVPFDTKCRSEKCQDVCVYLRPETNGIQVESMMMRTIHNSSFYRDKVRLVYLANLPGSFIGKRRIIEKHYHLKIEFAKRGRRLFTPYMKRRFTEYFGKPFETASVWGAFEAMKQLGYKRTDLFRIWVPPEKMLFLNGQNIKLVDDHFIINYDIPAILMKNHTNTDMAAMILRTELQPEAIHRLMMKMVSRLKEQGVIDEGEAFTRVFHFSRSPFEQILDGIGFIYNQDGSHIDLKFINFYTYLMKRGMKEEEIEGILKHPVFSFYDERDRYFEKTIYTASYGMGYDEAFELLKASRGQLLLS